jgi:hypothetical protein
MTLTTIALALALLFRTRSRLHEAECTLEVTSRVLSQTLSGWDVLRENPGIFRGIRLVPSRMIQADQR